MYILNRTRRIREDECVIVFRIFVNNLLALDGGFGDILQWFANSWAILLLIRRSWCQRIHRSTTELGYAYKLAGVHGHTNLYRKRIIMKTVTSCRVSRSCLIRILIIHPLLATTTFICVWLNMWFNALCHWCITQATPCSWFGFFNI